MGLVKSRTLYFLLIASTVKIINLGNTDENDYQYRRDTRHALMVRVVSFRFIYQVRTI